MRAFQNLTNPTPVSYVSPNYYDRMMWRDYQVMEGMRQGGLLEAVCCPASYSGQDPPWVIMPPGARPFKKVGSVGVMTTTPELETIVVSYQVPPGYNGVVVSHFNLVQANNQLQEASGDLTWRIKQNRRYIPDYGDITTTLGSLQAPNMLYRGGFRLLPQQIIAYTVTLSLSAQANLGAGNIICGLIGWYYPLT